MTAREEAGASNAEAPSTGAELFTGRLDTGVTGETFQARAPEDASRRFRFAAVPDSGHWGRCNAVMSSQIPARCHFKLRDLLQDGLGGLPALRARNAFGSQYEIGMLYMLF